LVERLLSYPESAPIVLALRSNPFCPSIDDAAKENEHSEQLTAGSVCGEGCFLATLE